jgi:hypothetical protein
MYTIQSKPKNNIYAIWAMCFDKTCDGKSCPCAYIFQQDAEEELEHKRKDDATMDYRITVCDLKWF